MKTTLVLFSFFLLSILLNYNPATAQNIPDFRINEYTGIDGSQQQFPALDGDGQGNYVITWMDDRNGTDDNIFAQIFLNDSTPLGNNFIVNDDVGTYPQYNSSVAVAPDLSFVITWLDRRNGYVWDVYAQRYSSEGTPLGANFKVNEETENEEQEHPKVSIDSCGNFVIVWADEKNDDYDYDIYGQRYLADGTAVGDNFKINDDNGNESQYWPTCEVAKNGNFIVAWSDKRYNDTYDIYAQIYLSDGTSLGNNFKVNTDAEPVLHIQPEITIMGNGNFIIAWGDQHDGDWDVYAQMYMSDGTTIGDNFKINDDVPDSDQRGSSVSADLLGNFVVCWIDDRDDEYDIYAQRFTFDAIPIGENFEINTDTTNYYLKYPLVSMDENGNFLVAWEDDLFGYNGDIFAQYYSNDGSPTGDNFMVNDNISDANQTSPSITKGFDDNFIIGWVENQSYSSDFYVQRFLGDGTALGNSILVNDEDQNYANYCGLSISADEAGNFVVAWDDFRYEYWGEIYAQRFASDGTAIDSNFKVNILSYPVVYGATVACKKNGDFIIIWGDSEDGSKNRLDTRPLNDEENLKQDLLNESKGSEPDVWAQQYLSDGTPLGDNFKVNDDENDTEQTYPVIAVDSIGNFIIAWMDNRNGVWEIYAQRYLSDGTAIDSNIKIVDGLNATYPKWPSLSSDNDGNFIITWYDNQDESYDIWAQQFTNNCAPVGDIFLVNDDTTNTHQSDPCVSIDGNGNFIITWLDRRNGNKDVYAQRYLSDGIPNGSNYHITNTEDLNQLHPSVILDENRIFSTWQDNRGGQSGYDIWANILNWDSWVGLEESLHINTPSDIWLCQNYPNPFHSSTTIKFDLSGTANVTVEIFNHLGIKIETLLNDVLPSGSHEVEFKCGNLPGGIYLYRVVAISVDKKVNLQQVRKMVILQ